MTPDTLYLFRCSTRCGEYPTSRETFLKAVSAELKPQLEERLAEGASGALFEFEERCPRCAPKGASYGTLRVLWAKPVTDLNRH
jgi:hypothetical protein